MSRNWENILLSSDETIQNALRIIDQEALRVALVVDEDRRLLGTVTDGDIRRALIRNQALDSSVRNIMSVDPVTAKIGMSRDDILDLMDSKDLLAIPLVSRDIVVGLETFNSVAKKPRYDNPVFIMAGGFGTRLRPLTDTCPKPMLKVGSKPILETVLLSFIQSGFSDFYFSTHYLPDVIKDYFGNGARWGVSISYVQENTPLGTGGALGLLPPTLPSKPIIVMNGDVLTTIDFEKLLQAHNQKKAAATMCVREFEYQVPFGVVDSDNGRIQGMIEKPLKRFHVNAGIYVIGREIIDSVSPDQKIDLPTLLEQHLDKNIQAFPFYDYWLDIGRLDDFNKAQTDIITLGL